MYDDLSRFRSGFSGLFLVFIQINKHKVNVEARLARHARLERKNSQNQSTFVVKKSSRSFLSRLRDLTGLGSSQSVLSGFTRKLIAGSAAFFTVSSFVPIYQLTEGNHDHDGVSYIDFSDPETQNILSDIITEDGFLLKPALNSTQGDRSTANEIFAYEVEAGDTLSSLAQRFGIERQTLIMENNLWNTTNLRTGSILNILPVDGVSHVVKKGDTVDKIAKKYDVEADLIMRQNQLGEGDVLIPETALIIPGGKKSAPQPAVTYTSGGGGGGSSTAPSNPAAYNAAVSGTGRLIWPTLGAAKLTQGFHSGHYALDIANRNKGPIFAAASGKVVKAAYGWNGGYGNYIIIDHGNGMQTLYGHNEKLYVTEGQYVDQGQTISWMGNSGRVYGATGIHVHFEVRINGVKYNPMSFF